MVLKTKGTNKYVEKILSFISEEDKINMEYFYVESLNREYKKITNSNGAMLMLKNDEIPQEESDFLLNYSGFNYKHIMLF